MGQRRKNPDGENTAYFDWAAGMCFTIGFLCFFAMPIIGWFYARVIQREAPVAFMAIMGGHTSGYFIVKMALIGILLTVGGTWVVKRHRGKCMMWAVTAGLALVLGVIWKHPPLKWLGDSALLWRLASTSVVMGFGSWLWVCHGKGDLRRQGWQWARFVVGLAAFFAFTIGGFVREHCKNPDTVYGEIVKPEWTELEADRHLVYEKWLRPRKEVPGDLDRERVEDWRRSVEQARKDGLVLTDDEADRIIRYLEENHQ